MHPTEPRLPAEKKACCAPMREAEGAGVEAADAISDQAFCRIRRGSLDSMRLIPGGDFVMGTDGAYGFAADGEGPAHGITLTPFHIDITCVTNEQFNAFTNATGYRTESERFGWSFVFFGHLDAAQLAKSVRATVLGSEWWCRVEGANCVIPKAPDRISSNAGRIPWCTCRGTTPAHSPPGRASDCRPKRSGNVPRVADSYSSVFPGAMNSNRQAGTR
jgi:formylglycine-generating enzyme required for sulfatase activity